MERAMIRRRVTTIIALWTIAAFMFGCASMEIRERSSGEEVLRIAIISAFSQELQKLRDAAEVSGSHVVNGRTCYTGTLAGHEVVMTLSGISMVNAAMTTQALLDEFDIRAIVFSGIAGGVNPDLNIGDVIVPAKWGQYQEQLFARETAEGWDTGTFRKEFDNFGMMFPQSTGVTRRGGEADVEEVRFWFPVDPEMLDVSRRIAAKVVLSRSTGEGAALTNEPKIVVGGNGVSGSTFVDNAEYRTWVWATFRADGLDMETAAVAHVAYVNQVPYIAFRSLSDLAGGGPGENEAPVFFQLAADNSAAVVIMFLEHLPGR
jgi:adenosylhomocysteine nucleosidase